MMAGPFGRHCPDPFNHSIFCSCDGNAPRISLHDIANTIWLLRREEEDRCDIELEDLSKDHSVWQEAKAIFKLYEIDEAKIARVKAAWANLMISHGRVLGSMDDGYDPEVIEMRVALVELK